MLIIAGSASFASFRPNSCTTKTMTSHIITNNQLTFFDQRFVLEQYSYTSPVH